MCHFCEFLRGLVTFNRLAVILLIIWVSSAAGLLTILMLRLGPDICHTVATDVNSATPQWSWPLPLAIMAVQVPEIVACVCHQVKPANPLSLSLIEL